MLDNNYYNRPINKYAIQGPPKQIDKQINQKPAAIAKLNDPAKAPNAIIRVLLASAYQQHGENLNSHTVHILNCLSESEAIDLERLKKLTFLGIDDEVTGLRPVAWRILLG